MYKVAEYDKFGVDVMEKEEYSAKQKELMEQCKCTGCPSYVEGDNPYAYCFPMVGTSNKIKKEVDCFCSTCPVFEEYQLDHDYYCTRCSELCQVFKGEAGGGHE